MIFIILCDFINNQLLIFNDIKFISGLWSFIEFIKLKNYQNRILSISGHKI